MFKALAGLLLALHVAPQAHAADAPSALSFLVGEWTGTGSGGPGLGVGTFSFEPDLDGQVLVRRAHSEYPATQQRPATVHDDLMIVYSDQSKAVYFDNEGHVIHYDISVDPTTKIATFVSTDPPPSPLFRLTYKPNSGDELDIRFDIAMDGRRTSLKSYLTGTVHRVRATKR